MYPNNFFSAIRDRSQQSDTESVPFYDLLKLPGLLVFFAGLIAIVWQTVFPKHIHPAIDQEPHSQMIIALLLASFMAAIRIIHSIYLAQRDYRGIDHKFRDFITFGTILVFLSGIAVSVFDAWPILLMLVYAGFCLVAVVNFLDLLNGRIPKSSRQYDYEIEKLVQFVNTATFLCIFCVFAFSAAHMFFIGSVHPLVPVAILCVVPLLVGNMVHSHQLSFFPKFHLRNDRISPESLSAEFSAMGQPISTILEQPSVLKKLVGDLTKHYKQVETRRATRGELDLIARQLIKEFEYVFQYLFATNDPVKTHAILKKVLGAGFGLGDFGYRQFYMITSKTKVIGFMKLETGQQLWLYDSISDVQNAVNILRHLGMKEFFGFLKRARIARRSQPAPSLGELRLSYIVIFEEYRKQNYGRSLFNLLKGAFLHSRTNGMEFKTLSMFVREHKASAIRLFGNAGCVERSNPYDETDNEFARDMGNGRAVRFEISTVKNT